MKKTRAENAIKLEAVGLVSADQSIPVTPEQME